VVPLPPTGDRRAAVHVAVGDERLGAILYDPELETDPAAAVAVARVAAIAIDRERLAREVSESRRALRDASSRLLDESDRQRRRIARDLHDGLQVSLVRLSMQAHRLAHDATGEASGALAGRLAVDVDEAASALRAIVNGVMPAPLVGAGDWQQRCRSWPTTCRSRATLDVEGLPASAAGAGREHGVLLRRAEAPHQRHQARRRPQRRLSLHLGSRRAVIDVVDDGRGGVRTDAPVRGCPGCVTGWRSWAAPGGPPRRDRTRVQAVLPCASCIGEDEALLREGMVRAPPTRRVRRRRAAEDDATRLVSAVLRTAPTSSSPTSACPPTGTDDGLRAALKVRSQLPRTGVVVLSQHLSAPVRARPPGRRPLRGRLPPQAARG
jgi:hypothetical protein